MKAIPMNDELTKASERAMQEHYEKFKRQALEFDRQKREAKERKEKETETPVKSAVSEK